MLCLHLVFPDLFRYVLMKFGIGYLHKNDQTYFSVHISQM